MSSTSFDAFSRGFCAALGLAPPEVQASTDAPAALSIDYREVALVLTETGTSRRPQVSLIVDFGDVPEHEQAEVYPALLQANFLMLEGGAPSFSLEQADPLAVCQALEGIADAVLQWRETRCLPEAAGHVATTHTPAHAMRA